MYIKITITDDHPLVVSGLKTILELVEHIKVVATYNSGAELLEGLKTIQPDVILTDLQMPGNPHGVDLIRQLKKLHSDIPVLILSGQETLFSVKDMMAQGSNGYLLKNTTDRDMLVHAIEQVYNGELFLEPSLKNQLLAQVFRTRNENEKVSTSITVRQKEILVLLEKGYTNQQIADTLHLSVRTIESHRLSLMQKLEVKNALALLKKAKELGLI